MLPGYKLIHWRMIAYMEKIGLLAGVGRLPVECARAAKAMGYEVYAVGLIPGVDPELKDWAWEFLESEFRIFRSSLQ